MNTYMLDHSHRPEDCDRTFSELGKYDSPLKGQNFWCGCEGEPHHGYFLVQAETPEQALEQLPPWPRASATVVGVAEMNYP